MQEEKDLSSALQKVESDLQTLMRITVDGFNRMEDFISETMDFRNETIGFRSETITGFANVNRRFDTLNYRVGQIEHKLDEFKDETHDNFNAVKSMLKGHEGRITNLESTVFPQPAA